MVKSWFGVSEDKAENLLTQVPGATATTPWYVPTYIAIIAGNRFTQSIGNAEIANDPVLQDKCWREAGFPKPVGIPKNVNGIGKLVARTDTFSESQWIVIAGSRKNPCIFMFKNGEIVFSTCEDDVRHRVLWAYTSMDNDIDGEQLLSWQQERLDKHR